MIIENEFVYILLTGLILLLLIAFGVQGLPAPLPLLRLFLGLAFVLFIPGYVLQAAIFPRVEELDGPERWALSFGLSVALVAPIALVLDRLPWGIRLWPIVAAEGLFILVCSVVAWYRRRRLPHAERFAIALQFDLRGWWAGQDRTNRLLYGILVLALLTAAAAAIAIVALPRPGDFFTEFYVLGPEGLAESYPRRGVVGEPLQVTVGIVNREVRAADYLVRIQLDGQSAGRVGPLRLAKGETWEADVSFVPVVAGRDLKLEFLLYKDGGQEPYRALLLWLDEVEEPVG